MEIGPNLIRVPKPARTSFHPERLIERNFLLVNQLKHFRKRELDLPPDQRTGIDFEKVKTEGEAAEYIRKLMTILHPQALHAGKTNEVK